MLELPGQHAHEVSVVVAHRRDVYFGLGRQRAESLDTANDQRLKRGLDSRRKRPTHTARRRPASWAAIARRECERIPLSGAQRQRSQRLTQWRRLQPLDCRSIVVGLPECGRQLLVTTPQRPAIPESSRERAGPNRGAPDRCSPPTDRTDSESPPESALRYSLRRAISINAVGPGIGSVIRPRIIRFP